jgi:hypothetical protein
MTECQTSEIFIYGSNVCAHESLLRVWSYTMSHMCKWFQSSLPGADLHLVANSKIHEALSPHPLFSAWRGIYIKLQVCLYIQLWYSHM